MDFLPPLGLKWSGRLLSLSFLLEHLHLHRQVLPDLVEPLHGKVQFCGENGTHDL